MSRTAAAEQLDDLIVGPDPDAFARTVIRSTSAALMMVDRDLTIIDLNDATRALLKANEAAFARAFPGVALDRMVGTSIDVFHKDPSHQRAMLAQPLARPHIAEISVGDLRFALRVMSVLDAGGDYVGNVLEWNDVTELRKHAGMLEALSKAQAVIEFGMDGTIQHANGNFLATVGYRLDEVVGRHHSMFVDPAEVQSGAYRAFWDKLGRGEYDAGQYRRVGRDGREVWIQASYNPILDARGAPFKVVKYAVDITDQKLATANFEGQIAAINKAQAVIEFAMDGSILDANDNFLSAVGYRRDEVVGRHHSLFIEPGQDRSPDYMAFWDKLRRGDYDAGQYRRFGKGGREIWIQASYNPILDLSGKPFKVVKYATDITAQKQVAAR